MWSNVISIERCRENEFNFLLSKVESIQEVSSAVEESASRRYIYLAGLCDFADDIRLRLEDAVAQIYLTYDKFNYYRKTLDVESLNHASVALYSTLTFLDYDFERSYIIKILSEMVSYDLEGIFHFRLRSLRNNWNEIAEMCNQLFSMGADDSDIFNVISYISTASNDKETVLFLYDDNGIKLKNLSTRNNIDIKQIYDNPEFNLINAIIAERASRLFIDNIDLSRQMHKALKHIIRVKKA